MGLARRFIAFRRRATHAPRGSDPQARSHVVHEGVTRGREILHGVYGGGDCVSQEGITV